MMVTDRVITWTAARAVIGVAAVAAVASYEHAYAPVRAHGDAEWTARLTSLTVDGVSLDIRLVPRRSWSHDGGQRLRG
jgi:hypothetical protein